MEAESIDIILPFEDDYIAADQARADRRIERRRKAIAETNYLKILVLTKYRRQIKQWMRPATLSLELLSSVPLDVFLEVLEYLHPIDLLHLHDAIDHFKTLLRERDLLWRHAFGNFEDVTPVPDSVEGFQWAYLLFGVSKCENCGSSPAHTNLTYQCRLCESCTFERFARIEEPEEAWLFDFRELFPICYFVGADPRNPYLGCAYRDKWPNVDKKLLCDAEQEVNRCLLLHPDRDGNLSASEELWDFRCEKTVAAHAINTNFWRVWQWSQKISYKYFSHCEHFFRLELFRMREKLEVLGHHPDDVWDAVYPVEVRDSMLITGVKRFSRRRFNRLLPLLEASIARARDRRLGNGPVLSMPLSA